MESETPVFFISVSAPVAAGVLTDMEKPDKNATGTSNAIPVSDIFALSDQLTPGCETYGLLYCTSEVNSVNTVNSAKRDLYPERQRDPKRHVLSYRSSQREQNSGLRFVRNYG